MGHDHNANVGYNFKPHDIRIYKFPFQDKHEFTIQDPKKDNEANVPLKGHYHSVGINLLYSKYFQH